MARAPAVSLIASSCVKNLAEMASMVEAVRKKGNNGGADTWLRIIVAIGALGEPPSGVVRRSVARLGTS